MVLSAAQRYLDCYNGLMALNDSTKALDVFLTMEKTFPEFWEHVLLRPKIDSLFGFQGKTPEEYDEAYLAFVDSLIHYAPDSYFYYQYKGIVLQALNRNEEAIKNFEIAYHIMPVSTLTYRSLLSAYISQGNYADAVRISKEFSFLNPLDEGAKRIVNAYSGMRTGGGGR
jgi:tetratricopeptide (TPR) repeat protein